MATTVHRGFTIQTTPDSSDVWQVQIKNKVYTGSLPAIKKSIDWWCDAASMIDPKEFASLNKTKEEPAGATQVNHKGHLLKNDTGGANSWYCFFNGRLIKGSKPALQKHIDAHMAAAAKKKR